MNCKEGSTSSNAVSCPSPCKVILVSPYPKVPHHIGKAVMLPALKAPPYKGKWGVTWVDCWVVGEEPKSRFPGHSRVHFIKLLAFFFIHGEVLFLPEARTIG